MNPHQDVRIGLGTDSHRIEAGGPMILGGIAIDYPAHFVGHSDADVLLHAITDAILGAAGFPISVSFFQTIAKKIEVAIPGKCWRSRCAHSETRGGSFRRSIA